MTFAPLALALVWLSFSGGQQGFELERLHTRAASAERARLFMDAWLLADEPARAAARLELAASTPAGGPVSAPLSPRALSRAWRTLVDSGSAGRGGELEELALSLDLRVTSGFFESREEGPGEVTTVHVRRMWEAAASGEVVVSLHWLPPPGAGEDAREVRARREPASPRAFEAAGFDMYVRPPASAPGRWQLVADLERGERRVRGVPVLVECLERAPEAIALAREALADEQQLFAPVAQGLLACALSGARLPAGLPPSLCRDILRDPLRGDHDAQPRPVELAFETSAGEARWLWSWWPARPARMAIVLLASEAELPEALFCGAMGARWTRLADQLGALLFATQLPPRGAGEAGAGALLARLLELAGLAGARLPLAVVAREHTLIDLASALQGSDELPFDALLAVWSMRGEPRLSLGSRPCLIVARDGPAQLERGASGASWVSGEPFALLAEPLLAEQARSWLPQALGLEGSREGGERR